MKVASAIQHRFLMLLLELTKQSVPGDVAFKLNKLYEKILEANEEYETTRQTLLKKYGSVDDKGELVLKDGNVVIENEWTEKFSEAIQEALDKEVKLVKLSLDDLKYFKLTSVEVSIILPIIA